MCDSDPDADVSPTHAGVVAYRREAGGLEVLLVEAKGAPHTWVLPKGHVEAGESTAAAARREALEEAGIQGTLQDSLGLRIYEVRGRPVRVAWHLLEVTFDSPSPEGRRKRWVPLDAASSMLAHEDQRAVVRAAAGRIAAGA